MRIIIVIFLFCITLPNAVIFAADPIVASIIVRQTEVRSGPDLSFYPTSLLKFGDTVEIYFATNNWYAIRPPLGNFSWVSAGHVSLGAGNIGVVLTTGLASRVGSDLTDSCDTVQVKLQRGEKILVLDKRETPENLISPLWFKISPPSGEYRWISREAVDPNFRNENSYAKPQNKTQTKIKTAEYLTQPSNLQEYRLVLHDESESKIPLATPAATSQDSPPPLLLPPSEQESKPPSDNSNSNSKPTRSTPNNPNPNPDPNSKTDSTNKPRANNSDKTANTINIAANNAAKNVVGSAVIPNTISVTKNNTARLRFDGGVESNDSGGVVLSSASANVGDRRYVVGGVGRSDWNFQRVFEELQSETVAALTGQTDDWVFVTLIEEANRLYNSAGTDAEMEKVYHIIESLKRGRAVRQDIALRRQANKNNAAANNNQSAGTVIPQTVPITYLTSSPSTTPGIAPAVPLPDKTNKDKTDKMDKTITASSSTENQFDVSGKLGIFDQPLPLKHPPFAVVDVSGRIICLLTPEAGTDLRQYVGKIVGINGIRGIYRKSGQPDSQHITVKTIAIIRKTE
ncbi:MAG: SH3 domain-containing protein [Planctomycetaceae bacterium]|jgi:hypothetical protein|nr:SH3 domain-containing protein [Planctomycetaceae bacterium]